MEDRSVMITHTTPRHPVIQAAMVFLPAILLLWGCSQMMVIPPSIEPAAAWNMIKANTSNPDLVIIDVRTEEEYLREHIPRSINLNVQSPSFRRDIDSLDRNKTYILYCRAANRSATARNIMKEAGFKNVTDISGGINAWMKAGLIITSGEDE